MICEAWIKECAEIDHYRYSRHADRERQNDGLLLLVCGAMKDWLVIVTVYIPTPPKFKHPYERG